MSRAWVEQFTLNFRWFDFNWFFKENFKYHCQFLPSNFEVENAILLTTPDVSREFFLANKYDDDVEGR